MGNNDNRRHVKGPYEEWLSNQEVKDKLRELIQKVGFPLEVMTRNIVEKKEYYLSSKRHYEQLEVGTKEKVLREIDIHATKEFEVSLPHCTIIFELNFVIECKYSSTTDFFIFENHVESLYSSFPVILTPTDLFLHQVGSTQFSSYFSFPVTAQNIAAADVVARSFFPEDKTIYDASNQVTNAVAYFAKSDNEGHAELYADDSDEYQFIETFEKHERQLNMMRMNHYNDAEISKYEKESTEDLLTRLTMYWVPIWIPLVVVGKNNALLKVIMDGDEVSDFEDVGYCIYPFTPNKTPSYFRKKHIARTELPIVVCNAKYLEKCIQGIEDGVAKIIDVTTKTITADPFLVCKTAYKEYQYVHKDKSPLL